MNKKTFALFLCFMSSSVVAEDGGCISLVFNELNHLPHRVESPPFRIWYAKEGRNALKNTAVDPHGNGHPIVINDFLLQLHTADAYFEHQLKLTPPLQQPRYKQAEFIDVHLISMEKGNGLAFDEVVAEKSSKEADSYSCGIKIRINSHLQPSRNVTPAHELFHLYQYSNSMFKARWYLEGMARWVEQAFRQSKIRGQQAIIPSSCTEVFDEAYLAARYWQDLAYRQSADDIVLDESFAQLRYSDGRPVFNTERFKNGSAVKYIFDELQTESHRLAIKNDLPLYRWPEKTQRSAQFNEAMCQAVEQSVKVTPILD